MKVFTFDPRKESGVLCGELIGKTFYRTVLPEHYMNAEKRYGIQKDAFQRILSLGSEIIILKESESSKEFKSNIKSWLNNGRIGDYGNGKQRFLALCYMNKEEDLQQALI